VTTLDTQVISNLEDARPYFPAWDQLAVDSSEPFCSPGWMNTWWLHAAPNGSSLRLILAFEGRDLVGVAPFFVDRPAKLLTRYRMLGAGCSSRLDLLSRRGMQTEVAASIASCVTTVTPRPDVLMFEGIARRSPLPISLAESWPGRPARLLQQFHQPAPHIATQGRSYEEWFTSKGRHFRHHIRSSLRQVQREGGSFRLASTPAELESSFPEFFDLHHRRWRSRGGSGVLNDGIERMLMNVSQVLEEGRLNIWTMLVNERPVGAHVFLSTGEESACWLGGFDDEWAHLQPALMTMLKGIEHSFSAGHRRIDLGPGAQEYKLRLADGAEDLQWVLVIPAGPFSALARTQLLQQRARMALARRLSPETKRTIRRIRARLTDRRSRLGGQAL
jgi:CelD/BcsL family acetyltransferase involved in cellulose biosynthesis